jgi:hypothetical protein
MPLVLNRAAIVYLIAFIVFCIGIWAVLSLGSAYASAPPDLSGSWRKLDPDASPTFAIKQSGRFVQMQFAEKNLRLDLILNQPQSGQSPLTLTGDGWTITVVGLTPDGPANFIIQPPPAADQSLAGNNLLEREDVNTANANR